MILGALEHWLFNDLAKSKALSNTRQNGMLAIYFSQTDHSFMRAYLVKLYGEKLNRD